MCHQNNRTAEVRGSNPLSSTKEINYLDGLNLDLIGPGHHMVTTERMTELRYDPDTLLVTIDETGHEHLANGHTVYGLGGVAVTGMMYHGLIVQPWRRVR